VRGVVEEKSYTGGSLRDDLQVGGLPDTTNYNTYYLRVGDTDYFVNPGESGHDY